MAITGLYFPSGIGHSDVQFTGRWKTTPATNSRVFPKQPSLDEFRLNTPVNKGPEEAIQETSSPGFFRQALWETGIIFQQMKAATCAGLANVYSTFGKSNIAEPLLRDALSIREGLLGPNHPVVGRTLGRLGEAALSQGKLPEAETHLTRSLRIFDQLTRADSLDRPSSREKSRVLFTLGELRQKQNRFLEAEGFFRQSVPPISRPIQPAPFAAVA